MLVGSTPHLPVALQDRGMNTSRRRHRLKIALITLALTGSVMPSAVAWGDQGSADVVEDGRIWDPPLGQPLRITTPFFTPAGPYAAGHRGFDVAVAPGDTVVAPVGGTISFVGTVVDRPLVSIRVDARTVVSLEPVQTEIVIGDLVSQGVELGRIPQDATTAGHCRILCLHVGVRVDGEYVNPLRYFVGRPRLLPW